MSPARRNAKAQVQLIAHALRTFADLIDDRKIDVALLELDPDELRSEADLLEEQHQGTTS
jgi:hypothetical protein